MSPDLATTSHCLIASTHLCMSVDDHCGSVLDQIRCASVLPKFLPEFSVIEWNLWLKICPPYFDKYLDLADILRSVPKTSDLQDNITTIFQPVMSLKLSLMVSCKPFSQTRRSATHDWSNVSIRRNRLFLLKTFHGDSCAYSWKIARAETGPLVHRTFWITIFHRTSLPIHRYPTPQGEKSPSAQYLMAQVKNHLYAARGEISGLGHLHEILPILLCVCLCLWQQERLETLIWGFHASGGQYLLTWRTTCSPLKSSQKVISHLDHGLLKQRNRYLGKAVRWNIVIQNVRTKGHESQLFTNRHSCLERPSKEYVPPHVALRSGLRRRLAWNHQA